MFFYRDPEEVEKQQLEEAQAKAAAAGESDAPAAVTDWDVSSAPVVGGINPALATEGGGLDWAAEAPSGNDWAAEAAGASQWGAEPQPAGWD